RPYLLDLPARTPEPAADPRGHRLGRGGHHGVVAPVYAVRRPGGELPGALRHQRPGGVRPPGRVAVPVERPGAGGLQDRPRDEQALTALAWSGLTIESVGLEARVLAHGL